MPPNPRLARLSDTGVSVWLDDLSRDRLRSGNLAGLIRTHSVVGVTTNPAIFRAALTTCTAYDEQIRELAAAGADADTVVRALTTDDVRTACDLLADTFHASGGVDGRVSLELDPRLAHDTPATIAQAVELWKLVDRPNLLIKIPATEAGIPAIAAVTGQGISVNVTLIFSRQRYQQVIDAYLDGLDAARATGHDLSTVHSVASFFVSRVDTEIDARLTRIGTPDALALRGKAALANARLAHHTYRQNFTAGTGRWSELAAAGAQPQRPLWASTGVKNPAYPDTLYVTELIAPDTVNTMPEATLHAVAEHAIIPHHPTIADAPEPSQAVFDALTAVGIDLADVFAGLETAGVDAFVAAWTALIDTLTGRLAP